MLSVLLFAFFCFETNLYSASTVGKYRGRCVLRPKSCQVWTIEAPKVIAWVLDRWTGRGPGIILSRKAAEVTCSF